MHKLTIVSGPNRGATYQISEAGETSLGRVTGNDIVLQSNKVSRRHCVLVASNGQFLLRDEGSANGTFVNGSLTKTKKLQAGDKISVGDFVLEFHEAAKVRPSGGVAMAQVIPFPGGGGPTFNPMGSAGMPSSMQMQDEPKDLKSKVFRMFEKQFMPIFYGILLKTEWRMIVMGLLFVLMIGNVLISIYPLLESNQKTILRETGRRASYMARELVERNAQYFASQEYGKTDIGFTERAEGVRVAVITDMELRVIAPSNRLNQYLTGGAEGRVAVRARERFKSGGETGVVIQASKTSIVAIEPLKVINPQAGRNVIVGMAVVSLDSSLSIPESGEIGVIYSETLVLSGIMTILIFFLLYRLTHKPFEVLNDDLDKALRGELRQVTHEFKWSELDSLWNLVNLAIQRAKVGSAQTPGGFGGNGFGSGMTGVLGGPGAGGEDWAVAFKMLGQSGSIGVAVLDKDQKVISINTVFEELSGIREDGAAGQTLGELARDQGFGEFITDLVSRAAQSGDVVTENTDFSGTSYKVSAIGVNGKGIIIQLNKVE